MKEFKVGSKVKLIKNHEEIWNNDMLYDGDSYCEYLYEGYDKDKLIFNGKELIVIKRKTYFPQNIYVQNIYGDRVIPRKVLELVNPRRQRKGKKHEQSNTR